MGAKLTALIELQNVELQIADIRRQLAHKERLVASQRQRVETTAAALDAEKLDLRRAQAQFDEQDVEIKARSAHITKLREQLSSIRTNKEYAAMMQNINNERADVAKIEARALELMGKLEERKAALAERERGRGAEIKRLEELQSQFAASTSSLSDRLRELEGQRRRAGSGLDAAVLSMFDRLAERYDGEALADVNKPNPRVDEYVCSGCNMSLRTEVANSLAVRDDVLTCRSCGRILVLRR